MTLLFVTGGNAAFFPSLHVFRCKAALGRYLAPESGRYGMVIWLDGDLTLMQVGIADFAARIGGRTIKSLHATSPDFAPSTGFASRPPARSMRCGKI